MRRPTGHHMPIRTATCQSWLALRDDRTQREIVARLQKLSRANGNDRVTWARRIGTAFAKVAVAAGAVAGKQVLANLQRRTFGGLQRVVD